MELGHDDWVGMRVARLRVAAGLSQEQLAARSGYSRSMIAAIETGKAVNSLRLLIALAEALGCSIADLTEKSARIGSREERALHASVPLLRDALDGLDEGEALDDGEPLDTLIDRMMAARMACHYLALARSLPLALARARREAEQMPEHAGLQVLYTKVCVTASLAIRPLGHLDLAIRLAEHAKAAAALSDDPAAIAAAEFALAQCCLAGGVRGLRRRSLLISAVAAQEAERHSGEEARAWAGMLRLQAAKSAAALGAADEAEPLLANAIELLDTIDGDVWRMETDGRNGRLWAMGIGLDLDPGTVPELARAVDHRALRTAQRAARYYIDLACGLHAAGRRTAVIEALAEGYQISAPEVAARVRVREIVGEILRRERRGAGSARLKKLAIAIGVDPYHPEQ